MITVQISEQNKLCVFCFSKETSVFKLNKASFYVSLFGKELKYMKIISFN